MWIPPGKVASLVSYDIRSDAFDPLFRGNLSYVIAAPDAIRIGQ